MSTLAIEPPQTSPTSDNMAVYERARESAIKAPQCNAVAKTNSMIVKTKGKDTKKQNYTLDRRKALEKKIKACGRDHISVVPSDTHTCHLRMSSSFFELVRKSVLNCFHTPLVNPVSLRQLSYEICTEKTGLCTTEIIRIHNWQVVKKPKTATLHGSCKVIIHIYRTTSSILIQGKDTANFVLILAPHIEDLLLTYGSQAATTNEEIAASLRQANQILTHEDPRHMKESYLEITSNKDNDAGVNIEPHQSQLPHSHELRSLTMPCIDGENLGVEMSTDAAKKTINPECAKCLRNIRSRASTCDTCGLTYHYVCEKLSAAEIDLTISTSQYTCKSCRLTLLDTLPDGNTGVNLEKEANITSDEEASTSNTQETPVPRSGTLDTHQIKSNPNATSGATSKEACQALASSSEPDQDKGGPLAEHEQNQTSTVHLDYEVPPTTEQRSQLACITWHPTQAYTNARYTGQQRKEANNASSRKPANPATEPNSTSDHRDITNLRLEPLPQRTDRTRPADLLTCNCKELEKELKQREKLVEKKETQMRHREQQLSDKSIQMASLRAHVTHLEAALNGLEEENRLLKIQVLSAKTLTKDPPSTNNYNEEQKQTMNSQEKETPRHTGNHSYCCNTNSNADSNVMMAHMMIAMASVMGTVNNLTNTMNGALLNLERKVNTLDRDYERGHAEKQVPYTPYHKKRWNRRHDYQQQQWRRPPREKTVIIEYDHKTRQEYPHQSWYEKPSDNAYIECREGCAHRSTTRKGPEIAQEKPLWQPWQQKRTTPSNDKPKLNEELWQEQNSNENRRNAEDLETNGEDGPDGTYTASPNKEPHFLWQTGLTWGLEPPARVKYALGH